MPAINERSLGVARLYARAMLQVASDQGAAESLGEELEGVLASAERDPEFGLFLSSPVLERDKRRASLEAVLRGRASDLLVDSLQVVNKKGRLGILPQIVANYHEQYREQLGQVEVRVTTAVELTDAMRNDIRERIKLTRGKDTYLVETIDPDLLGGLVVQIGDQKIDMSVRRDLELLSQRFAARLSSEMLAGEFGTAGGFDTDGGDAGDDARASHDGREEE